MFEDRCQCTSCPLRESKAKLGSVPGEWVRKPPEWVEGDPTSAVFIGISPAHQELKQKRPMIGPSGTLGRKTADEVGYTDYYITNSMLCWYPEQATEVQIRKAIECCKPRLEAELEYLKPKVIVPMGAVPTAAVLGVREVGIMAIEGRLQEGGPYGPVLPVRQPAAVLRRTDEYPDFKGAMENGVRVLKGTFRQAPEPTTTVVGKDHLWEVLERVSRSDKLVIDLETTRNGFFPYGRNPDSIRCIALAIGPEEAYILPYELLEDPECKAKIKEVLEGHPYCVYHNGGFDCGFLFQEGIYTKIHYDTMLAHFLIDEREYSHGLKALAGRYLGAGEWEQELAYYLPNKKASYDLVPDGVLYPYAGKDVCYTYLLEEIFAPKVSPTGGGVLSRILLPASNMFNEIRHTGMRINIEELMNLDTKLDTEGFEMEQELQQLVGFPLNPNSPPEVISYIYDTLGLPVNPQYGRTSSKRVLRAFEDVEEVGLIMRTREFRKLQGTYVRGVAKFIDYNWRIHPFTKLFGTITGRISTEDPSIMNITKKGGIKVIYQPEADCNLMEVDFSGMELRAYAVITKDQELIRMIEHGDRVKEEDVHNTVAKAVTERTGRMTMRGPAKTGVFGRMYGRGITSFESGFRVDRTGAEEIVGIIDRIIPSLPNYNKWVKYHIHSDGELVSFFGRRRRFPLLTDENKAEAYRQGGNFLVQSMASDIDLLCMLHMWDVREEFGATPMFPVHDSIIFSIHKDADPYAVKAEIERYANEVVGGTVPFLTEAAVGPDWGHTEPL